MQTGTEYYRVQRERSGEGLALCATAALCALAALLTFDLVYHIGTRVLN
jgi:hypothetical protein